MSKAQAVIPGSAFTNGWMIRYIVNRIGYTVQYITLLTETKKYYNGGVDTCQVSTILNWVRKNGEGRQLTDEEMNGIDFEEALREAQEEDTNFVKELLSLVPTDMLEQMLEERK